MRSKKTYREYRESESTKFPALAWLLDQTAVYAVALLIALFAIGSFMKMGWDSYSESIKPAEVITPYADVTAVNFSGKAWAEKLIATNPANFADWSVDKSTKPRSAIDSKNCPAIGIAPTTLLSTHVANSAGTEVRVQVYGAGQAAKQFTDYSNNLASCFGKLNPQTAGKTTFETFSKGFILTSGDAIVGVTTVNDSTRDVLLDFYLKNVEPSLLESGCISLEVTAADANRNLFFNKDQYSGLEGSTTLTSSVEIGNLPTPTGLKLNEIENTSAEVPEAPLPANFPELPKNSIQRPQTPVAPKSEGPFTADAKYRVTDDKGPGCGWSWTAQVSPALDLTKLAKDKNNSILKTQGAIDGGATTYVNGKLNWALQIAALAPSIDSWNTFVSQTNAVHKKWEWLDTERQKLEAPWRQYVTDHNDWLTFDQRKSDALKKFDEDFKQCQKDQKDLADWNRDWKDIADKQAKDKAQAESDAKNANKTSPTSSPSATPTPTPSATSSPSTTVIPPKPAGCDTPPTEPEILTQKKPDEPKAPAIPKDVTIPASWPTPKTN